MTTELSLLCLAAFAAGFIDAVVGGGGLIQIPAMLVLMPGIPVATAIATTKIPSFCGTSIAAAQFSRRVQLNYKHLALMGLLASMAAFSGSKLLTVVSSDFMKPLLLFVLTGVAIYIYCQKDFGVHSEKEHTETQHLIFIVLISLVMGFYDGFIGPGSGSFLILAFITLLGFDFLKASATAKFVNLSTNIGSIILFSMSGKIIYSIALPMAACNAAGGFLGARLAILRGNKFIRIFFLSVVILIIIRFAYDVLWK
jgi:uncharacterized membrane protein YfcA